MYKDEIKEVEFFNKNKTAKSGFSFWCKSCISNYNKENKEYSAKYNKKYYEKNKDKIKNKTKNWKKQNKEKMAKWYSSYKKQRRSKDPKYKLSWNISSLMRVTLQRKGVKKTLAFEKAVGYTISQLKEHLENKFDDKMSWENYGSYWHVDHIKPVSLFNFSSIEDQEFKDCWALNNLQPLEAIENIKKGNKYEPDQSLHEM